MLAPFGVHMPPDPVLGTPVISVKTNGGCSGGAGAATNDRIQGDWTLSGFDANYFTITATLTGGAPNNPGAIDGTHKHCEWNAPGSIFADTGPTTVNWVLTVKIVRKSDNFQVASKSSATWTETYLSTCSSIH